MNQGMKGKILRSDQRDLLNSGLDSGTLEVPIEHIFDIVQRAMAAHHFGGDWTAEKLERVRKYLAAYTTIFAKNPRAQSLRTIYVDAFAGTGYVSRPRQKATQAPLFSELVEPETSEFLKGSTRIALEVEPPFDNYLFVERRAKHTQDLRKLKQQFPERAPRIKIVEEEANSYLQNWAQETDWRKYRAVVFLDPYGMQVEWALIEALARTKAIDLWILFPIGVGVNRLLTKAEPPPSEWANTLTRIFGTSDWKEHFYSQRVQPTLFGDREIQAKEADFTKIGKYFNDRLKSVFTRVAPNPLPLRNSKNIPLYLLCFAAGNPKGAPTAIRIAEHILR